MIIQCDYWQINDYYSIAKLVRDGESDDEAIVKDRSSMPFHLGAFFVSNGKR